LITVDNQPGADAGPHQDRDTHGYCEPCFLAFCQKYGLDPDQTDDLEPVSAP